jgi:hypothetical protein
VRSGEGPRSSNSHSPHIMMESMGAISRERAKLIHTSQKELLGSDKAFEVDNVSSKDYILQGSMLNSLNVTNRNLVAPGQLNREDSFDNMPRPSF